MIYKLFKKKVAKPVENVHPNIISVGKHTYNHLLAEIGSCKCRIGNFCSIAKGAKIGVSQHIVKISSHPFYYEKEYGNFVAQSDYSEYDLKNQPVEIGNDVWIGANTVIMPSVKIGNGAIIGAGSIITKNIPPYAITGGGANNILKFRFDDEKIALLQKTKWWDWSDEYIKEHIDIFKDENIFFDFIKNKFK